jgi:arginyl-tRNA synthetase
METIRDQIKKILNLPDAVIDQPENKNFGDYSTSVVLRLSKKEGKNPVQMAGELIEKIKAQPASQSLFSKIEIAGPGFINFYLSPEFLQTQVAEILKAKEKYGALDLDLSAQGGPARGGKIQVEFISANPTGPLTLGNGRGGFYGDVLASVLEKAGFNVKREYFVNDAGYQVEVLGHSYRKDEKAQYKGAYLENPILQSKTEGLNIIDTGAVVASYILETYIRPTVQSQMKIKFDEWVSEKAIRESGLTEKVLAILKSKSLIYEQDGATWFKSTEFGDDKDRVLITSAKEDREQSATYLLPDIAYHYKKFAVDKFDTVIDVWGADHHGYIARLQAAGKALGEWDEKNLKIVIMQLVRLFSGGQEVKMSKRLGTYITLDELLEEIPLDVARWFFLMRSPDTHMDFDMDLAKEQSDKNPVYYAQYAYARISSILAKSQFPISNFQTNPKSQNSETDYSSSDPRRGVEKLQSLNHPSELALIKQLIRLPEIIEDTARDYQVHRLPQYALDLVRSFHKFYEDCKVLDETNKELTQARLALCGATKIVLKNVLDLMGVSAPDRM